MEDKKKGIRCSYGVLIVILFATVCLLTDYIVIDRKLREDKSSNSDNLIIEDNSNDSNIIISKVDTTKDYVYDAVYDSDDIADSYSTFHKTFYLKDIVVPYVNIDSEDASKVNDEIKSVYNSAIAVYKKGIEDKVSYVDNCSYKYYINDDILSLVLTYGHGATDVVHPDYYIYNFDLKTGKLVSYSDVYSYIGFNSDNISESVKSSISSVMSEKMSNFPDSLKADFDTYNNQSFQNYINSVDDGTIKYFIDSNKKLNIIVTLSIPAGTGMFDTIISVD